MSIEIECRTIRWCCERQDLVPYKGEGVKKLTAYFCKHCGQIWAEQHHANAVGGVDIGLAKMFPKL